MSNAPSTTVGKESLHTEDPRRAAIVKAMKDAVGEALAVRPDPSSLASGPDGLLGFFADAILGSGALGCPATDEDIERVARAITIADGCDPDQRAIGLGHKMPEGQEYALWECRVPQARAAIAALNAIGLKP